MCPLRRNANIFGVYWWIRCVRKTFLIFCQHHCPHGSSILHDYLPACLFACISVRLFVCCLCRFCACGGIRFPPPLFLCACLLCLLAYIPVSPSVLSAQGVCVHAFWNKSLLLIMGPGSSLPTKPSAQAPRFVIARLWLLAWPG